ncbi:MAG: glycosyltransferase family 39 protein [Planctomycetes bacterium]|nr:glycosyltransferase family 39 protein [Planctomycetota bacterium]
MNERGRSTIWIPVALVIAIASAILAGRSATHLERLWDEQVDHDIAVGLRAHPLTGERPAIDASQLRLPMYVNALVFAATGHDDLATSRFVSLACGALTVVATAALANTLFGPLAAILAALLLGFSPYFLSFERIAMTEGDVFFACFVTLAVQTFVRYLQYPSNTRWTIAGVMLALAIGSKFFAIFLFPVFFVLATSTRSRGDWQPYYDSATARRLRNSIAVGLTFAVVCPVATWAARRYGSPPVQTFISIGGWAAVFAILLYATTVALQHGALPRTSLGRILALISFAILACAALMPVHVTEPDIAVELARRTLRWDHRLPLALWSDHLRLYSGIVLLKLSIPLGIITSLAMLLAAFRERDDGRWRPCILPVIFYVVLLCFLPLRQTFYLMGVYPLIMILTAAMLAELMTWSRATSTRIVVAVLIIAALAHGGWLLSRSYPHLQLHGYRICGDSWMGRESRGYRNLIQTPSDGVEEMIRWCISESNVRPGANVVSFLWEERIIESILPHDARIKFVSRGLSQETDAIPPPPSIQGADVVLLHINNLLGYGDRPPDTPPMDILARDFRIGHTVTRGPLAVGWVYVRK